MPTAVASSWVGELDPEAASSSSASSGAKGEMDDALNVLHGDLKVSIDTWLGLRV
jgi:hypothetical protein